MTIDLTKAKVGDVVTFRNGGKATITKVDNLCINCFLFDDYTTLWAYQEGGTYHPKGMLSPFDIIAIETPAPKPTPLEVYREKMNDEKNYDPACKAAYDYFIQRDKLLTELLNERGK